MNLQVNNEDGLWSLWKITEELQGIFVEMQQTADEEIASDEEEDTEKNVHSLEIKYIFSLELS